MPYEFAKNWLGHSLNAPFIWSKENVKKQLTAWAEALNPVDAGLDAGTLASAINDKKTIYVLCGVHTGSYAGAEKPDEKPHLTVSVESKDKPWFHVRVTQQNTITSVSASKD